jgi:hypothetical protein
MRKPTWKQVAWVVGGGVGGFLWYYFIGCATGTCPISSNPYISTGYGMLVGALAGWQKPAAGKKTNGGEEMGQ